MPALQRRYLPYIVLFATGFCVFVLPFLLPPEPIEGISSANIAGFNNKISSVTAALISVFVFFIFLRRPSDRLSDPASLDRRTLSRTAVLLMTAAIGLIVGGFSYLIVHSGYRYMNDAYYFINRVEMHTVFGRTLYDQIEFPYGHFIFYGPIVVEKLFHLSGETAYFVTLVLECMVGTLLAAFVIDRLPIAPRLKLAFFLLAATFNVPLNFGINETYIRFFSPAALLIVAWRMRMRPVAFAAVLLLGQLFCLSVSPEIAFGFFWASLALAAQLIFANGVSWLPVLLGPIVAIPLFFAVVGLGYVRMLKLFAGGYLNLVIEPQPYILIFLFALVWLVPKGVAAFFQQKRPEAPLLTSLYILSLALLPAAFGTADPGHVLCEGIMVYALSMVAISQTSHRARVAWVAAFAFAVAWTDISYLSFMRPELQTVVRMTMVGPRSNSTGRFVAKVLGRISPASLDRLSTSELKARWYFEPLDIATLKQITGDAPVYAPFEVSRQVEGDLFRAGKLVPSFYCYYVAIVDLKAEVRKNEEMNRYQWALLPEEASLQNDQSSEPRSFFHMHSPIRRKRSSYVFARLFDENLAENWQPWTRMGGYRLYKRR